MKRLGSRKKFFRLAAACGKPEKKISWPPQPAGSWKKIFLVAATCGKSEKNFPGRRNLREAGKNFSGSPQPAGGWKKFFLLVCSRVGVERISMNCNRILI